MSTGDDSGSFPKSMRQKRILDAAAENPGASIDELASMVPSATTDLVERVFEEHGDPAAGDDTQESPGEPTTESTAQGDSGGNKIVTNGEADVVDREQHSSDSAGGSDTDSEAETTDYPSPEDLSPKQREVLRVIAAEPEATQAEIGDRLGVTQTTVNSRVNSIDGFEWSERESFVEAIFDGTPESAGGVDGDAAEATETSEEADTGTAKQSDTEDRGTPMETTTGMETEIERLRERVTELEAADERQIGDDGSAFEDPELVHRIVHACMASENISESEELRILKAVLEQ